MASEFELFNFKITPEERASLMRRAAQRTLKTGRRVTMSDMLRDAIRVILNTPDTDVPTHTRTILFTPTPKVTEAIQRASFSSGRPIDDIINAAISEALQLQEAI